jgi:hypothetical protein
MCFTQKNDPYIVLNLKHSSKRQKYEKNVKWMLIDWKTRIHYTIQCCCRNRFKSKLYEIIQRKNVCFQRENDPYIKFNMKHSSKRQKYEKNVKCLLIDWKTRIHYATQFFCRNWFKNKLYEIIHQKMCVSNKRVILISN